MLERRSPDLSAIALHNRLTVVEDHAKSMTEWRDSVEESTKVQREMIEVGKDIIATLRVLSWVGSAAKWLARITISCGIMWASIKGFSTHFLINH